MNLYHIQYDNQSYWVEAAKLAEAVEVWKLHVKRLWGDEYDDTEEPESIALVNDEPVIRAEDFEKKEAV